MCGGWPVEVGAGEASLWLSWRPGPGPGPGHITTILLQPLQSAAAPQMGHRPHTAPSPQSSWRGHQTSDDSFTRPRARSVSSKPGPRVSGAFRSEEWGLVRLHCSQSQPGAGPGPGADYRDRPGPEHNTATDTCHYTGEHSDSGDQPTKDERFCWIQ